MRDCIGSYFVSWKNPIPGGDDHFEGGSLHDLEIGTDETGS